MEIAPIAGRGDDAGADEKVPEPLRVLTAMSISCKERIEGANDLVVLEVGGIKLREARAVKGAAEIEIITARPFAHESDLGDVRTGAAIGAARHANGDLIFCQT